MIRGLVSFTILAVAVTTYSADVPSEISTQYKKIEQCIINPDVRTFKTLFDPSFVNFDEKGKKTAYPEFMKQIEGLFAGAISGTAREKLTDVVVHSDRTEVKFDLKFSFRTKTSELTGHEMGIDTWKKKDGQWRLVKTVDTLFTVNTKTIR